MPGVDARAPLRGTAILAACVWFVGFASARPCRAHETPITFAHNGGWCWFQDPRAIVNRGKLVIGSVSGSGGGDVRVTVYDLARGEKLGTSVLHRRFQQDDHNAPALFARPDGRLLAMYAKHNGDTKHYWRISEPGDPLSWGPERNYDHGRGHRISYMNLCYLAETGVLYNFYRETKTFQPHYMVSTDHGSTWHAGGHFVTHELGGYHRPYVRYVTNGYDVISFIFTDGHPRKVGNSLYYAFYKNGAFHRVDGTPVGHASTAPLKPSLADRIFAGDTNNRAWGSSVCLDAGGNPYCGYSVRLTNADHRYRFARWDGARWHDHEVAYAGGHLYARENDYTGLITVDPTDRRAAYISADVDPSTGAKTGTGTFEVYCGVSEDDGQTFAWTPLTSDSRVRNIRPVCVAGDGYKVLLWLRGEYRTYTDYRTDVVGVVLVRRSSSGIVRPRR